MFADEYYDTNVTSLFLKITVFDECSKKLVSLVSLKLMVFFVIFPYYRKLLENQI